MKRNKMKNQFNPGTKAGRCPYCGAAIELRSADGIYKDNSAGAMLYVCSGYPDCDAYVRVIPGSKTPVGSMANGVLRALRREAHQYFDRLHLTGMMTRKDAYEWLACILQTPLTRAHIGCLGEYYCQLVIDESKKILANWRRANAGKYVYRMRSAVGR